MKAASFCRGPQSNGHQAWHRQGCGIHYCRTCKPCQTHPRSKEIAQIGTISANSDATIGNIIAEAMSKGWQRKALIPLKKKPRVLRPPWIVVEGMRFDRGYLSPYFVTNAEKMICEMDNPYILLTERKFPA